MIKPPSHRGTGVGFSRARRPGYIRPDYGKKSGIPCGGRGVDSPFISSYEDKRTKARRQMRERAGKYLALTCLALFAGKAAWSWSGSSVGGEGALRGGGEGKAGTTSGAASAPAAPATPAEPKVEVVVVHDNGWGKTYGEAHAHCASTGHALCPYSIVCPEGHASSPQSQPSAWVPIFDAENDWVALGNPPEGRTQSCVRWSTIYPSPPAWGVDGDGVGGARRLHCCKGVPALPNDPSVLHGKTVEAKEGRGDRLCETGLPFDLAETEKWPVPFTSLLGDGRVASDAVAKEAILLTRDRMFGALGAQLNSFFHAYDAAYDAGMPLYLTKDSWAIDTLSSLFFKGEVEGDEKHALLERLLRVKVVESEASLLAAGITVPKKTPPHSLFYTHTARVDAASVRNHRETALRRLLSHPAEGACSTLDKLTVPSGIVRYAVIHVNAAANGFMDKLNAATGRDLKPAGEMSAEYVLNILKKNDMLDHALFPITMDKSAGDQEILKGLAAVPELTKMMRNDEEAHHLAGDVFLAVLADVYIGNPADALAMWIARMRHAIDVGNTYVLTEKRDGHWESYVDNGDHLALYDAKKLGVWMA